MLKMTKIALAAIVIAGSAGAALAASENDGGNETGGYVLPGNTEGVNPAYHPGWFPNYARTSNPAEGRRAYGYVPTPKHHVVRRPTQDAR